MASQARHEMVSPYSMCASRTVVLQLRWKRGRRLTRWQFRDPVFMTLMLVSLGCDEALDLSLWLGEAFDDKAADDEIIHFRVHEAAIGVVRSADDGFAANVE